MRTLEQTRGEAGTEAGIDRSISRLAGEQYGVVSRGQLLDLGLAPGAIGRRLRTGRLHRLHPGVYAVGHEVVSKEGRWLGAVLSSGPGAVLSHHSAAALWRIRPLRRGPLDVTVPGKSSSNKNVRRHFSGLPGDEITVERGIPVTTVPRTIFDLAAVSPMEVVEGALRESEYLRLHDRLSLLHLLERYPGHRGNRAIRRCIQRRREAPGRSRSWLEERFLPFLDLHRLSRPHLNAWIEVEGGAIQVDCLWREARTVVELDGFAAHGTRMAFRDDRARDRRLRVAGYGVTRIAPEQLEDEPEAIAADLQKLLSFAYKRS